MGSVVVATLFVNAFANTERTPLQERLMDMAVARAALLNCYEGSIDRFDDRVSPADVVASAVAWHCEAEGKAENYWVILAQRRTAPDTVDMFYRDLALPFVLQSRAKRLRNG
ncbi:MAG TPA: hypothetical protein VMI56_02280 [Reyranella sp.]|nr:hypothetical protein [Reyranella sp.]